MQYSINSYLRENRISFNKLLENLFKIRIKNVTYLGKCKLRKMPDYKFVVLKYNVVLEDFSNYTIFIRLIDEDKIEENLFCYWFFCEEYYGIANKKYISKANIINYEKKSYETKYSMEIINRKNEIWKKSIVDVINLKKYCEQNTLNSQEINKSVFIAII